LVDAARTTLERAGAHVTIASIAGLPVALDQLEERIARGEQP
jgi:hypothetical protein